LDGDRDFKFGRQVDSSKSLPKDDKSSLKGALLVKSCEPFKFWWSPTISLERQNCLQVPVGYIKSQHTEDKSPLKREWSGSRDPF